MTFASVLFFCCAGIAACAALVFGVETVVALCLREREVLLRPEVTGRRLERGEMDVALERAA